MEEKKLNDDELDMVAGGLSLGHIGGNERIPDGPLLTVDEPGGVSSTSAESDVVLSNNDRFQDQIVGGKNGPQNPFA